MEKPHWVYHDPSTKDNYLDHLELTPGTRETLVWLKERGTVLVVLSANPYVEEVAVREIKERLGYFGLSNLFYAVRSSDGNNPAGKTAVMLEIIAELGVAKTDALMVGDSYYYDYVAAKEADIDAFFIENNVAKMPEKLPIDLQSIQEESDLIAVLE